MVDPPIQKLLIPEIVIERSAIDSMIIDQAFFGEDKQRVSGILFHFAWRDLINLKSAEILETRIVDENRVVFTVYSTEWSYHDDGDTTTVQDILAVRRSEKWYVVRLFGMLTHYFRGNDAESDKTKRPLLQSKNGAAGVPNRRNADYQLQFNLPIEFIHAELVECSKSKQMTECLALASQLQRHFKSVENQAKRGRIKSRADWRGHIDRRNRREDQLTETGRPHASAR